MGTCVSGTQDENTVIQKPFHLLGKVSEERTLWDSICGLLGYFSFSLADIRPLMASKEKLRTGSEIGVALGPPPPP